MILHSSRYLIYDCFKVNRFSLFQQFVSICPDQITSNRGKNFEMMDLSWWNIESPSRIQNNSNPSVKGLPAIWWIWRGHGLCLQMYFARHHSKKRWLINSTFFFLQSWQKISVKGWSSRWRERESQMTKGKISQTSFHNIKFIILWSLRFQSCFHSLSDKFWEIQFVEWVIWW